MSKHANLAIFVPHAGCPNRCVFCNQARIAGRQNPPDANTVAALCERYLPEHGAHTEIAFFGGSFTAIDSAYMRQLLQAAYPFVRAGRAAGIRVSTRPDAVDGETLRLLKRYGVTAVELGAQSMDDTVLARNRRGHTARQVTQAAPLIRQAGLSLGLQMMVGMYGEDDAMAGAFATARAFIALMPDTVRIYPTVVIPDTALCDLYRAGAYRPLETGQAVDIVAQLLPLFSKAGIRVIRIGLHAEESLAHSVEAGAYHPALGEQCYARVMRDVIENALAARAKPDNVTVFVNPQDVSRAVGYKRENIIYFEKQGIQIRIRADEAIKTGTIRVEQFNG